MRSAEVNRTGKEAMECRIGCAACCIAPSISSSIPGMEHGKPSDDRCVQLSDDNRCRLFGSDLRPNVCSSLRPNTEMCGTDTAEAMETLLDWERKTSPETLVRED